MNELYLVAVRLSGWEFMAEASHINAKKAVRGLAADLQEFHEQGQRSSASHLMQQGAQTRSNLFKFVCAKNKHILPATEPCGNFTQDGSSALGHRAERVHPRHARGRGRFVLCA
jgi:hypothetical protein